MDKEENKKPIVTVVMPTYNAHKELLGRSVESAIKQTFKEWELIIVDDVSTNGTADWVDEWARKDARIKVIHKERNEFRELGISGSLNRGIDLAKGKYIARLDQDDYWIEGEKLKKQVAYLDAHQACVAVGGGVVVVDEKGGELFRYFKKEDDKEIRKTALFANPFSHTTVLFRKDVAVEAGKYQGRHIEDWDLWLRMGRHGTLHNIQEYFVAYTMSDENSSFLNQRGLSRNILRLITRERGHYPSFAKAYMVNFIQYLYAWLPIPISLRIKLRTFLTAAKRKIF